MNDMGFDSRGTWLQWYRDPRVNDIKSANKIRHTVVTSYSHGSIITLIIMLGRVKRKVQSKNLVASLLAYPQSRPIENLTRPMQRSSSSFGEERAFKSSAGNKRSTEG